MTISVDGTDSLRTNEGQPYAALTDRWSANAPTTDKGRFSIVTLAPVPAKLWVPSPYTLSISGVVQENAVNKDRTILLYRRSDGAFVHSTVSDGTSGAYSFTGLVSGEQYFVVALDDLGTLPNFDALILDQLTAA